MNKKIIISLISVVIGFIPMFVFASGNPFVNYAILGNNFPLNGTSTDLATSNPALFNVSSGGNYVLSPVAGYSQAIHFNSGDFIGYHGLSGSVNFYAISVWVKLDAIGDTMNISQNGDCSMGSCNNLIVTSGGAVSITSDNSDSIVTSNGVINDTNWHNIIVNEDGGIGSGRWCIYVDGIQNTCSTGIATNFWDFNNAGEEIGSYYGSQILSQGSVSDLGRSLAILSTSSIASIWNGGNLPKVPSLSFIYPVANTDTPPFDKFYLNFDNLTSTDIYSVHLTYNLLNGGSCVYVAGGNICPQNQWLNAVSVSGATLLHSGVTIPFIYNNAPGLGEVWSYSAMANLVDVTNNVGILASTTIFFDQLPVSGVFGTSTVLSINPVVSTSSPTSTATGAINYGLGQSNPLGFITSPSVSTNGTTTSNYGNCNAPTSLTDWGGGLIYAGCVLFTVPSSSPVYAQLTGSFNQFQSVFPFSLFFGVTNGVDNAINGSLSSTPSSLPLNVLGLNGQYVNLGSLDSSTDVRLLTTPQINNAVGVVNACDGSCASEKVNNLFDVFIMLIWMTAGIKMVMMVAKFVGYK